MRNVKRCLEMVVKDTRKENYKVVIALKTL